VIGAPIAAVPAPKTFLGALLADAPSDDDSRYFGALPEPLRECRRVGVAAPHAQRQGLDPRWEGVER